MSGVISKWQMAERVRNTRQKIMEQNQHYIKTGEWTGGRGGPPAGAVSLREQRLERLAKEQDNEPV